MRDKFSHPYNGTGKITVPYIYIFKFLERGQENKIF
jgi:hypothetical protein